MSEIMKIVIPGDALINKEIYNLDVKLSENKNFFIMGTIYDDNSLPINNAAIAVYQVDELDNEKKTLIGITFSYKDGTYGMSLSYGYSYILMIYS